MIDNRLVIIEDLIIILPVYLSMILTICYTLLYVFGQTRQAWANSVDPDEKPQMLHLIWVYTVCHSFSEIYTEHLVLNCTYSKFK